MPVLKNRVPQVILVIVLIAAALVPRLLTYDRYLPYSDYTDESVYIALADEIRGFSTQTALREQYGLLAPLYVSFNVGVQTLTDAVVPNPWHLYDHYYHALRLASVLFGVLTTLLIAWTGYQLAGIWAALIGGLVWALSQIVVELNSLAIPDPILYLACSLAVAAAVAAWQRRATTRRGAMFWLTVSLFAGIGALYIKLWPITAMLPFVTGSLLLVVHNRRDWLPRVGALYLVAAIIALHFIFVLDPLNSTNKIADNAGDSLFQRMFDPLRIANNLWHFHYPMTAGSGGLIVPVLIGGIAGYLYFTRKGERPTNVTDVASIGIVAAYALAAFVLTGMISNVDLRPGGRLRHILPAIVALIPLWAASLVWIVRGFASHFDSKRISTFAPAMITAVVVIAALPGLVTLYNRFARVQAVTLAQNWFDASPPLDGTVLMPADARVGDIWNRLWGTYTGSKPFTYLHIPFETYSEYTPAELRAQGITWVVFDDVMVRRSPPPNLNAWLESLLYIKTIDVDPGYVRIAGDPVRIYRVDGMDFTADALFGGSLRLAGYDLRLASGSPIPDIPDVLTAGSSITVRPYWRLNAPTSQPISMFIHVYAQSDVDAGSPVVLAQVDTEPLHNTNRPPLLWTDTDELYFGNPVELTLRDTLPAGNYVLAIGLYDYTTGVRLPRADASTYYSIPFAIADS